MNDASSFTLAMLTCQGRRSPGTEPLLSVLFCVQFFGSLFPKGLSGVFIKMARILSRAHIRLQTAENCGISVERLQFVTPSILFSVMLMPLREFHGLVQKLKLEAL